MKNDMKHSTRVKVFDGGIFITVTVTKVKRAPMVCKRLASKPLSCSSRILRWMTILVKPLITYEAVIWGSKVYLAPTKRHGLATT